MVEMLRADPPACKCALVWKEKRSVPADDSCGGVVAARFDTEHREHAFAPLHGGALLRRQGVSRRAPPILGQALRHPHLVGSHGREQPPAVGGLAPRGGARCRYTLRLAQRRDLVHFGTPTALLRSRREAAPAAQERPNSAAGGEVPHPAWRSRRKRHATAPRGDARAAVDRRGFDTSPQHGRRILHGAGCCEGERRSIEEHGEEHTLWRSTCRRDRRRHRVRLARSSSEKEHGTPGVSRGKKNSFCLYE
jgi:hypothetical protein